MFEILAQDEFGPERDQAMAGPLGAFVTVFLVIVIIFLVRGMNKHVRRSNERFEREAAAESALAESGTAESAAEPDDRS